MEEQRGNRVFAGQDNQLEKSNFNEKDYARIEITGKALKAASHFSELWCVSALQDDDVLTCWYLSHFDEFIFRMSNDHLLNIELKGTINDEGLILEKFHIEEMTKDETLVIERGQFGNEFFAKVSRPWKNTGRIRTGESSPLETSNFSDFTFQYIPKQGDGEARTVGLVLKAATKSKRKSNQSKKREEQPAQFTIAGDVFKGALLEGSKPPQEVLDLIVDDALLVFKQYGVFKYTCGVGDRNSDQGRLIINFYQTDDEKQFKITKVREGYSNDVYNVELQLLDLQCVKYCPKNSNAEQEISLGQVPIKAHRSGQNAKPSLPSLWPGRIKWLMKALFYILPTRILAMVLGAPLYLLLRPFLQLAHDMRSLNIENQVTWRDRSFLGALLYIAVNTLWWSLVKMPIKLAWLLVVSPINGAWVGMREGVSSVLMSLWRNIGQNQEALRGDRTVLRSSLRINNHASIEFRFIDIVWLVLLLSFIFAVVVTGLTAGGVSLPFIVSDFLTMGTTAVLVTLGTSFCSSAIVVSSIFAGGLALVMWYANSVGEALKEIDRCLMEQDTFLGGLAVLVGALVAVPLSLVPVLNLVVKLIFSEKVEPTRTDVESQNHLSQLGSQMEYHADHDFWERFGSPARAFWSRCNNHSQDYAYVAKQADLEGLSVI